MTNDLLLALHQDLLAHSDEATRKGIQRFFKEEAHGYGVPTRTVNRISRKYFHQIEQYKKEEIWRMCETLLATDCLEDAFVASDWSYRIHARYTREDFEVFQHWISRYINNWAKCDTFCNHTMGKFLEMYPGHLSYIKEWTASDNRWLRRAAAVSLILPARKGLFLANLFEIAEHLLLDPDDLVQKGYGWMLKEASKQHQMEVFTFVMEHKQEMPRTALRYAIEKMPPDLKRKAMERSSL